MVSLDQAKREADLRRDAARELHVFVDGMTLENVLVRPHRRAVERFAQRESWVNLSNADAEEALALAGLPSAAKDPDEDAKRFDLLILRRQLAQLEGDAVTAERLRGTVQSIAAALLGKLAIPSVAAQAGLLESVAGDEWWVDVSLPMLELARLRLRGLVRFVEKTGRKAIYTDFEDTLGEATDVALPYATPGTDPARTPRVPRKVGGPRLSPRRRTGALSPPAGRSG